MNPVTAAIRAVLHDSDETDPAKLAVEVDRRLSDNDRASIWLKYLSDAVRLEIGRVRQIRPTVKTAAGTHASPRLAASASWWQGQLRSRYNVGGRWVFLADMTLEDVLAVVAQRTAQAEANARQAARFRALAAAMVDSGVDVVRDIPEAVAVDAFRDAA